MKVLFLTIVLGLVPALFFPVETPDITGTLYVKATVTDKDLPKEWRPSKVSPVTVTALDGGDLEVTFTFVKKGQCHEKGTVIQPTEEPGKYSAYGGKRHVYILELPVKDHYVFYCEGHVHGKQLHVGKLMGRNPEVNPEALEAFKRFAQRKGLSEDDISIPTQTEGCRPENN
uniref:Lipocalin/cytosolic fatty-acid binding domain-containing protein n=1 Tax=Sus scrofa TaxID=9823 RepID=A0A8D0LHQ7_PIG